MSCQCNHSCFQNFSQMAGQCCCKSNCGYSQSGVQPIVAPKKVCTSFHNQYVEQPVICPIECRRVNNVIYYPRYYPQYEETYYTQNNNNNCCM